VLSGFADISLLQLLMVRSPLRWFASVIGGLAGLRHGRADAAGNWCRWSAPGRVVPIIAISAIFTNLSRTVAYFRYGRSPPCADRGGGRRR